MAFGTFEIEKARNYFTLPRFHIRGAVRGASDRARSIATKGQKGQMVPAESFLIPPWCQRRGDGSTGQFGGMITPPGRLCCACCLTKGSDLALWQFAHTGRRPTPHEAPSHPTLALITLVSHQLPPSSFAAIFASLHYSNSLCSDLPNDRLKAQTLGLSLRYSHSQRGLTIPSHM